MAIQNEVGTKEVKQSDPENVRNYKPHRDASFLVPLSLHFLLSFNI